MREFEGYFHTAKMLLSRFHFVCNGSAPLRSKWTSPETLLLAKLQSHEIEFMGETQVEILRRGMLHHTRTLNLERGSCQWKLLITFLSLTNLLKKPNYSNSGKNTNMSQTCIGVSRCSLTTGTLVPLTSRTRSFEVDSQQLCIKYFVARSLYDQRYGLGSFSRVKDS